MFTVHDHNAQKVEVLGSWDGWRAPISAFQIEQGAWRFPALQLAPGEYTYKFLLDGRRWLDDPANPRKSPDGAGGLNTRLSVS